MNGNDLRETLKDGPMGPLQKIAAIFCAIAIISDGYDTASFSLAAPFIIKSLGLAPKALGLVFSAVALGMVAGALLGSFADRIGRRTVILAASGAAGVLMLLTGSASSIVQFVVLRFFTGCAVGAMVTTLNVLSLEHSNRKWGGFFLALVHVGIGLGASLGAGVAVLVIGNLGWRWIFYVGGVFNLVVVALGLLLLPESIPFLLARRPTNALDRTNRVLRWFGHVSVSELPAIEQTQAGAQERIRLSAFASPALLIPTALLATASFAHFITAYFHNSWAPKLLIDAGLNPETALSGGIAAGLGSLSGNLFTGLLCARFDPRHVSAGAFLLGTIALLCFGFAHGNAAILLTSAAIVSMFGSATNTGVYLSAARSFPVAMRGSGVGVVAGIGRIGAVAGPALGGILIGLGWGRASYYPIFAACYLVGSVAIFLAARRKLT